MFWTQTPRLIDAALTGRTAFWTRAYDQDTAHAHMSATLGNLANNGKLPKLEKLLRKKPRRKPQSGDEVLAIMRDLQARGAAMTIRKVER